MPDVPTYDDSRWPLFVVRMPPQGLTPEGLHRHLEACRAPYRRMEPFVMLIDMADHPALTAEQRKAVSEAMKADNARYPHLHRGLAIVVKSALERGIITAITWIARPEHPFAAFNSSVAAETWLLEKLKG